MARICIVTPGQLASNPRTVKEAEALVDAGHTVHVIATRVLLQIEPRDQAILTKARWSIERIAFDSKIGRATDRLIQLAARTAFRITRDLSAATFGANAMTRRLSAAAQKVPADLYIGHYVAALPAVAAAAQRYGSQYAFDAEDFHTGDLPDLPQHTLDRELIDAIEQRWLPGAAYVTAASPGIAKAYATRYGIVQPQVVLNVFPLDQSPAGATPSGTAEASPSLYWFSQTIGPDRGLECALAAIAIAKSAPTLYLRGMISGAYRSQLRELAEQYGVGARLKLLPPGNPEEMARLAASYDIGLVSETGHTENRRIALTNKQFTYLLAGVPSLMSDIPSHRDFAQSADGAVVLYRTNEPQSLATAIDAFFSDPDRLSVARKRAFDLGQAYFNWEREREALVATVERSLNQHQD